MRLLECSPYILRVLLFLSTVLSLSLQALGVSIYLPSTLIIHTMAPYSLPTEPTSSSFRPSSPPAPRSPYSLITPALLAKIKRQPSPPPDTSYLPITLALLNAASATASTDADDGNVSWWTGLLQSRNKLVFLGLGRAHSLPTATIQDRNSNQHLSKGANHSPSQPLNVQSTDIPQPAHLSFINYSRPFSSSNNPHNNHLVLDSQLGRPNPSFPSYLNVSNRSPPPLRKAQEKDTFKDPQ
jgi:hypothetical protein